MRAKAPASSANLGPGFDTLALALALYVEVEVHEADSLVVTAEGEGADLPRDAGHLAAQVATAVAGHSRLAIHVRSEIPVGRGLGSSAALAAAAAAAAGAPDPLAVAAEVDGHPENAAASVAGGLITATTVEGRAVVSPLVLDPDLSFVVLIPDRTLPTKEARAALPPVVPHADAAFNLGRMGLLLSGLADATRLRPEAVEDRLHQQQRAPLFPEAAPLMAGLVEAGALAACWSGAGPTLLGVCRRAVASDLRAAGEALLGERGVAGRALVLDPDRRGLTITG
ncbi:MAG TPA: homoserine kinase [Acidimicrobiales bacterium]|jgi:homoserine kinase|nr:homoserine kinase [Acidimicrobiales bacterium]